MINRAMRDAQDAVKAAGQDARLLDQAREQADRVLRGGLMLTGLTCGWFGYQPDSDHPLVFCLYPLYNRVYDEWTSQGNRE